MGQPAELGPYRLVDRRLAVAVHGDPQRGDPVEVAPPVGVDEVHALAALDHQRVVAGPQRVLGERVPDAGQVAGHQRVGTGCVVGSSPAQSPMSGNAGRSPVRWCRGEILGHAARAGPTSTRTTWPGCTCCSAEWQLLADLSFADLLLWVPMRTELGEAPDFLAVAQMRPTTGPTSFQDDVVGRVVLAGRRPLIDAAFAEGRICREGDPEWRERRADPRGDDPGPPRRAGHRRRRPAHQPVHRPGAEPARDRLPAERRRAAPRWSPRDASRCATPTPSSARARASVTAWSASTPTGRVIFASPNALSAYRRLGLTGDLMGAHLGGARPPTSSGEEGPLDEPVAAALEGHAPRSGSSRPRTPWSRCGRSRCCRPAQRSGAIVLVRDVTELRRRDRAAAEQGRDHPRDPPPGQEQPADRGGAAAAAGAPARARRRRGSRCEESVRRVGSIALVHETLSLALDEAVDFDEIADQILAMVGDVAVAGGAGRPTAVPAASACCSAEVATPLALVLTELLQNAVEHGLGAGGGVIHGRRCGGRRRAGRTGRAATPSRRPGCGWSSVTTAAGCRRASTSRRRPAGTADRPDAGGQRAARARSSCGRATGGGTEAVLDAAAAGQR